MAISRTAAGHAWLMVTAGAILLALGTGGYLWARYGTVVFFETIRTGFAACFG